VCNGNERRLPDGRGGNRNQARNSDGAFRESRRPRWRGGAPCVERAQPHHGCDHRRGRWAGHSDQGLGERRMDFTLAPEIEDLRLRVRAFVEEHVLPLEADPENFSEHENIPEDRLAKARVKAKTAGLWGAQSSKESGGMALPIVAWAAIYEEAAR